MRDVDRITRITWKLTKLWMLVPDERFGQLLENYIYPANIKYHKPVSIVEWGLEDDKLEKRIDQAYATVSKEMEKQGIGKTARKIKK
jgi:hypothetical protein